jgi:hypothetical protein
MLFQSICQRRFQNRLLFDHDLLNRLAGYHAPVYLEITAHALSPPGGFGVGIAASCVVRSTIKFSEIAAINPSFVIAPGPSRKKRSGI